MRNYFGKGLLFLACGLSVTACSEDKDSPASGQGTVTLDLEVDRGVVTAPASRSSLAQICEGLAADDFTVRLTGEDGETQTWAYSEFNGQHVKIGTYTLEAYAGIEGREGFDSAYFLGSTSVTVTTDATTSASVTASLANAAVKVVYTDAFRNYMTGYSASVRTSGSTEGIAYGADATDELFVNPGDASLYVTFTTPQGKTATLKAAEFKTEARHCYNIKVDVNGGEIGDAVLTVTFDDSTVAEDVEIVLSDELLNAPAPTVSPVTSNFDVIAGNGPGQGAKMNIMARGGIGAVRMVTSGTYLLAQNWPAEIDLMKADAATRSVLESMGLKVTGLWKNPDIMAVVDFAGVIEKIETVSGDNTTTFRIEVEDRFGKVSEPAGMMTVNVSEPVLAITGHEIVAPGDEQVTLHVDYNGDNFTDVTFKVMNDRGTWEDAQVISTAAATSRAETKSYTVTLKIPAATNELKIKAIAGKIESVEHTVAPRDISFTAANDPKDNFATHAIVTLASDDIEAAALARIARVTLQPATGTVTAEEGKLKLVGLTPGTHYTVSVTASGKTATLNLDTEAATQLPNSGMETWSHEQRGDYQTWWFPASSKNSEWGTMNDKTTSTFGTGSKLGSYGGTAYRATSGTMPANGNVDKNPSATANSGNQHSGSNAALIRTVGWGKGNTSFGYSGKCENVTAGELFLGSTDASFNAIRGMGFASRPKSLSFQYKYLPFQEGNGDFGLAEIKIKDAGGNVIAQKSVQINSTSSYTLMTLPLDYPAGCAKASSIEVNFYSSGNSDCLKFDKSHLSDAGSANWTNKEYTGSKLYIDDIILNY